MSVVKTSTKQKEKKRFKLTYAASAATVPVTLLSVWRSHLLLLGSMHLLLYFSWLHVCDGYGLSFIVSLLLLFDVQCSRSLIYRLSFPVLCCCSLELLLWLILLIELLRTPSGLSVIASMLLSSAIQCSRPPTCCHHLPALRCCFLELLSWQNLLMDLLRTLSGLSVMMLSFL